ncbi:acyl-CoA thioesterase [Sinorhizobium meliloti]|uniref:acyl-CoA thioesterase n=1 Tax=Rhizobium meliloti TaxID=382 RepID=UPI000FD5A4C9|nr:thioesterase family protein [Sinorhizobium meliloti]MQV24871.1 acyl-CoA thioesterase [Sinorhizobium meliloti]MQV37459.1 acyl-CoA thioesterase [Sinorhizobium meliloti]RVE79236.1 acyl-CoA thioesterase [Sinorhizobium meliloti]RVG42690.1 acyl-CoA thioesterase [Sinorhizobium meliloti]RVM08284.1 acyl-CoA thioesterase [Sinorhizobium meliloti]
MTERTGKGKRSDYKVFRSVGTRWSDNDIYGHMNNVVHYSMFDTAVNGFLIENGVLDIKGGAEIFLVVETGCRYHAEMAFPDVVTAGIRVAKLGNSSVRYEIGLFRNEEETAAAEGFFIHVNVDRLARRPVHFSNAARRVLEPLLVQA